MGSTVVKHNTLNDKIEGLKHAVTGIENKNGKKCFLLNEAPLITGWHYLSRV